MDISSICRENRKERKRILLERRNKFQKYHTQIRNEEIIPESSSVRSIQSLICKENRRKRKMVLTQSRKKKRAIIRENSSHHTVQDSRLSQITEAVSSPVQNYQEIIPESSSVRSIQSLICKENRRKRKIVLTQLKKKKRAIIHENSSHHTLQDSRLSQITEAVSSPVQNQHIEPSYLGLPEYQCQSCGALLWYNERIYKHQNQSTPRFSLCCQDGRIRLPLLQDTPGILDALLDYQGSREATKFRENIRAYNSMFAFTSIGARVDININKKPGPYIFRISGQNHHIMGSLLPADGQQPKFAQLYIYDTENEVDNRMRVFGADCSPLNIDKEIVIDLIKMFDIENEIVKAFRMARDRFKENDYLPIRLRLVGTRNMSTTQYNPPSCAEIAGLIVGDLGAADRHRDIIVEHKTNGLKRISDLHPSFMAMQYPILFPYGEDGFTLGIPCNQSSRRKTNSRQYITMREFYAYRIQNRPLEGKTLIRGGRLFQQYIVDAFSCVEEERLSYIRNNQSNLRCEIYKGIKDAVVQGDVDGNAIGKRIILPSSFTAGPRYMIQNYQDAIAICRHCGPPDLFITFTCNAQWQEIRDALHFIPGQRSEDRPDIVSRVFKMKLESFMADIKKNHFFGQTIAELYTVEFQKRGLPHVHILVWLHANHKYLTNVEIDSIISAEIPDKDTDPDGFAVVEKFMIHGPCGLAKLGAPCMVNGYCSKHFPKEYNNQTIVNEDGFPIYRRRNNQRSVLKNGIELDNRFVVPHNLTLLRKYQAHINVEWCNKSRLVKYLFKYINKGPDRSAVIIENNVKFDTGSSTNCYKEIDEIKQYLDCRYLSAYEAVWRLFEFDIHFRQPSVERLTVHLPLMNNVTYRDDENLENLLDRPDIKRTMLTTWMETNLIDESARELTYAEFPTKWVWHPQDKFWSRRRQGNRIGRMVYIHPTAGEVYFLRLLLNIVKGPTSYQEIRTVNGIVHETFQSACNTLGLLGNDREWADALTEASLWSSANQLRELFVTLIMFCEVSNPIKLWDEFWELLSDDILHRLRNILGIQNLQISQTELQNHVLFELNILFNRNGSSLDHFNLPMPNRLIIDQSDNRLLREETDYNIDDLKSDHARLFSGLNNEQRNIYNAVLASVYGNIGDLIFVYGHGGTGKTYLWKTIISKLRSEGKVVLAVASSGIASLLLPGGRTAHSRFKIPIKIDDCSICEIKKGTHLAKLVASASLIIWDEAPMNHRNCFEALDKSLKDILESGATGSNQKNFGGKTVLLGGDFRQILPVVVGGTRHDIINASLTKSTLWSTCKLFRLETNMRLLQGSVGNEAATLSLAEFSKWVLDIGDGKIHTVKLDDEEEATWIQIPDDLLIKNTENGIESIVQEIYNDIQENYKNPNYLRDRAIVTPINEIVDEINTFVLSSVPGEERTYLSSDSVSNSSGNVEDNDILYPADFLNSLKFNGVPHHELKLKIGVPVMLLRNINQSSGLCNGTRLLVTQLSSKVIEAQIFTGNHIGEKVYIPRIVINVTDSKWPFILKRRQFPIRLCYAMTINKSQGQTLQKVGIYLSQPVFSHGQLYVAISRVTSREGLRIFIRNKEKEPEGYTRNIVFHEIFEDL